MTMQRGVFGVTYEPALDACQDAVIRGDVFELSYRVTLATSGDTMEIGFTVPTGVKVYADVSAVASTIATLTILEGVTSLAEGSGAALTAYNQNRNSSATTGVTPIYRGTTGGAISFSGGTTISTRQLGTQSPGGAANMVPGIVLKSNASTVVRLASGANTCDAAIVIRFVEDPR